MFTQATSALFERHRGKLDTCLASFEQVALNAALRVPPGLTLAAEPVQPVRFPCETSNQLAVRSHLCFAHLVLLLVLVLALLHRICRVVIPERDF